jgi:DNA-binding response OmpR family regulator
MRHALIIDDNMAVSRGIRARLQAFGFDSFDYTWTQRQALAAAAHHRPDLIVIGDSIADGSAVGVAREVAIRTEAPVLALTADKFRFERSIPEGTSVEGPYRLSELDDALASAQVFA